MRNLQTIVLSQLDTLLCLTTALGDRLPKFKKDVTDIKTLLSPVSESQEVIETPSNDHHPDDKGAPDPSNSNLPPSPPPPPPPTSNIPLPPPFSPPNPPSPPPSHPPSPLPSYKSVPPC